MSHFTVAVFHRKDQDIEELLAPYNENIIVAPYVYRTKQEIIEDARERLRNCRADMKKYAEDPKKYSEKHRAYWLDGEKISTEWVKNFSHENDTDEEIYAWCREGTHPDDYNEDGDELSTYNPNSKWDWYSEGGRWGGILRLKVANEDGKMATNEAQLKDLDFEINQGKRKDEYDSYHRWWEIVIDKAPLKPGEEKLFALHKDEYYKERYKDADDYAKQNLKFRTFAALTPNGEWHEPGTMGWWCCNDSTPESQKAYDEWFDNYLATADPELVLTIVDCHIQEKAAFWQPFLFTNFSFCVIILL